MPPILCGISICKIFVLKEVCAQSDSLCDKLTLLFKKASKEAEKNKHEYTDFDLTRFSIPCYNISVDADMLCRF